MSGEAVETVATVVTILTSLRGLIFRPRDWLQLALRCVAAVLVVAVGWSLLALGVGALMVFDYHDVAGCDCRRAS